MQNFEFYLRKPIQTKKVRLVVTYFFPSSFLSHIEESVAYNVSTETILVLELGPMMIQELSQFAWLI